MERAEYEALVSKMEVLSRADPAAYRRKVRRWATGGVLGYWAVFTLTLLAAAVIVIVMLAAGVLNGFLIILALGALWAALGMLKPVPRIKPEAEFELPPERAPKLQAEIADLGSRLGAPRVDAIVISGRVNASASIQDRGRFRKRRCVVELGLPLMLMLSPDEIQAVIAHELAHHVHDDTGGSYRIGRLYHRWESAANAAKNSAAASAIARAFVEYYFPRFSAITDVFRRQAEFEADSRSAAAVSADAAVRGLLKISIVEDAVLGQVFENWVETLDVEGSPVFTLHAFMVDNLRVTQPKEAEPLMRAALNHTTTPSDSHPALRDRLDALGRDPNSIDPADAAVQATAVPNPSAAEYYFGQNLAWVAAEIDADYNNRFRAEVQELMKSVAEDRMALTSPIDESDPDQLVKRLNAHARRSRYDEALAYAIKARALKPSDAEIEFLEVCLLLRMSKDGGLERVKSFSESHPDYARACTQEIAEYYHRQGRSQEARDAAILAHQIAEDDQTIINTMVDLSNDQPWYPHRAKQEDIEDLVRICEKAPFVQEIYIVERRHERRPEIQVGLIVVSLPSICVNEETGTEQRMRELSTMGWEPPIACTVVHPKSKIAIHARQHVPPVYVRQVAPRP